MGMMKWLAMGLVAIAFAATFMLGNVAGIASNQKAANNAASLSAIHDADPAATDIAIRSFTALCLKQRAGGRLPPSVNSFLASSLMYMSRNAHLDQAEFMRGFQEQTARKASTMRRDLMAMEERQRTHIQLILSDFSARPEELMGCVTGMMKSAKAGS